MLFHNFLIAFVVLLFCGPLCTLGQNETVSATEGVVTEHPMESLNETETLSWQPIPQNSSSWIDCINSQVNVMEKDYSFVWMLHEFRKYFELVQYYNWSRPLVYEQNSRNLTTELRIIRPPPPTGDDSDEDDDSGPRFYSKLSLELPWLSTSSTPPPELVVGNLIVSSTDEIMRIKPEPVMTLDTGRSHVVFVWETDLTRKLFRILSEDNVVLSYVVNVFGSGTLVSSDNLCAERKQSIRTSVIETLVKDRRKTLPQVLAEPKMRNA